MRYLLNLTFGGITKFLPSVFTNGHFSIVWTKLNGNRSLPWLSVASISKSSASRYGSGATFNRLDIALQQTSHSFNMNQRMFGIQPHVSFNMGDDRNKAVVNQLPKLAPSSWEEEERAKIRQGRIGQESESPARHPDRQCTTRCRDGVIFKRFGFIFRPLNVERIRSTAVLTKGL